MSDILPSGSRSLGDIFRALAHHMQEEFQETLRYVDHPLEKGLARERLLIEYLRRFLPERYGIDSGFVVDSRDKISKQIDIVIYDKIIPPVFELPGNLKYFPCECVVAVGEVKSTITDRETFANALEKLKSVQVLDKFSSRTNLEVAVHGAHGHFSLKESQLDIVPIPHRTLGFIFTSQAMSLETMISCVKEYCAANPKLYWPNIIVDFGQYLISYLAEKAGRESLELFPDDAIGLYATRPEEIPNLVLLFACLLTNFLTVARVTRPMLLDYFGVKSSQIYEYLF